MILQFFVFSNEIFGQALLDPSFDGDGKVTTQIGSSGSKGNDAVLQPDGKIVVVGSTSPDGNFPGSYQIAVVRYNADGSLDTSFDGDGKLTTRPVSDKVSEAHAVALQSDGKIVVVGQVGTTESFGSPDAVVLRYNSNGSLDNSFDGDGIKTINFDVQFSTDVFSDVVIQPDGKIVVAGSTIGSGCYGSVLTRFESDGSFDANFGAGGYRCATLIVSFLLPKLALQTDGKLLVLNNPYNSLLRYNSNGTLDETFGSGGIVANASGNSILVQPDGKIIIVNTISQVNIVVWRYNANGALDTTFGANGTSKIVFTNEEGNIDQYVDAALQSDGKIVVGGSIKLTTNSDSDFALARLNTDGSTDNLFGFNGRLTTDVNGRDIGHSVLIQPDGKILLVGESRSGSTSNSSTFTLARYVPQSASKTCRPVSDFNGDGKSDLAIYDDLGTWRVIFSDFESGVSKEWGLSSDHIVPADYNGDCRTDFAVYRNGTWYVSLTGGNQIYYQFGLAGDIPVPADYDGDDLADPAVYRNGTWYVLGTRNGFYAVKFGLATDKPVPGDFDGDGMEDFAVYRDGTWYFLQTTAGFAVRQFGLPTDKPTIGDYDGDSKSDVAVYRPSDGTWYMLGSTRGFSTVRWGIETDTPIPADYDGDGKTDVAVYRGGDWYMLRSSNWSFRLMQFGGDKDRPIPKAYIP
ncbi:MAG TPA: hypothetical protein VF556_04965 [Pyrinomonadaceae bacterium]